MHVPIFSGIEMQFDQRSNLMTAHTRANSQGTERKSFLERMSRRNKIVGVAVLVFLVLLIVSIPGDRTQLLAFQEQVDAAQAAYELAFPAVSPIMQNIMSSIDETGVDLTGNRTYSGLTTAMSTFNRDNATAASRFQGVVTFSTNVHSLLDGNNAVPELDTEEFRTLAVDMDTTFGVALLALMELNDAVDGYNGYHNWISASAAGALFGLPQNYTDPVPSNSRLSRSSLDQ